MASGGHHDLGLNYIGVHAHLCVMVERDKCPVGHCASHIALVGSICLDNQILDCCCIEQLDVVGLGSTSTVTLQQSVEMHLYFPIRLASFVHHFAQGRKPNYEQKQADTRHTR